MVAAAVVNVAVEIVTAADVVVLSADVVNVVAVDRFFHSNFCLRQSNVEECQ